MVLRWDGQSRHYIVLVSLCSAAKWQPREALLCFAVLPTLLRASRLEGFRHEIEVKLSYLFRLGVLAYMKLCLFETPPPNTVGP